MSATGRKKQSDMDFKEEDVEMISALADKTRLQILFHLGGRSMSVNEITALFDVSRPAVSHHLKVLKNSGLVVSQRRGQEIYYAQAKKNIVKKLRDLADVFDCC